MFSVVTDIKFSQNLDLILIFEETKENVFEIKEIDLKTKARVYTQIKYELRLDFHRIVFIEPNKYFKIFNLSLCERCIFNIISRPILWCMEQYSSIVIFINAEVLFLDDTIEKRVYPTLNF